MGAGTFGHHLEAELRSDHGVTTGHWPQSIELSTVGGWLACRSAGQYSTRYGKIEDMVVGLDVVLADGTSLTTGGFPRQAVGPDLTQLFVGSEGTLGVITGARLRVHPVPPATWSAAFGFASFGDGIDACRRILRRGATPAVLRLYDGAESARSYGTDGTTCVLLVLDEADAAAARRHRWPSSARSAPARRRLDDELVDRWLAHRNDVSALHALTEKGFVVDTMEIAAPWARLPGHLRPRPSPPCWRCRAQPGRHRPPVAQLHRRRLPLLHLRGHAAGRRRRVHLRGPVGRRAAGRARRRRRRSATTTASG